jgi:hypothetical protein
MLEDLVVRRQIPASRELEASSRISEVHSSAISYGCLLQIKDK